MDKVLSVTLATNVAPYVAGLRAAAKETDHFARQLDKAGAASTASADKVAQSARKNHEAIKDIGRAGVVAGTLLLAGFGIAARATLGFDKAISGLSAATHASAKDLRLLRQAALDAGAATAFSATDAARAQTELAKAGVTVKDILGGGLRGALDLAAAGQLDVGRAAEIAATALTQFKLAGGDVGRVADALAAGAGKAQGEVEDIGQALQQSGLVAAQFGLSVEDTVGSLAMFAKAGLIGSDAGTSFKTALSRMVPSSAEAKAAMDKLGISFFDARGQFIGIERAAGVLKESLSGLTQEQRQATLQTIFGQDAIRAATVLYENGAEGVRGWRENVSEAGFAAATAAEKLDNLAGDLEALGGSFETALIGSGSQANGVLRELVQTTTGMLNLYNDLPGPVQGATTALLGVGGAVALVGGAALLAVPKIEAFKLALATAGPKTQALGKGLLGLGGVLSGPWGAALGVGVVGLGLFANAHQNARQDVEDFTEVIQRDSGALAENTRAAVANRLEKDGLLKKANELGYNLEQVTDAILGDIDALNALQNSTAGNASENFDFIASLAVVQSDVDKGATAAFRLAKALGTTGRATGELGGAAADAAPSMGALAGKFDDQKAAADAAADEVDRLKQLLDELIGVHLTAAQASRAVEASLDDLATAAAKAAKSRKDFDFQLEGSTGRLKDDTKAQRAAGDALEDSIKNITEETDALLREGVAKSKVASIAGQRIDKLRGELIATGLTTAQVDKLLRSYGLIKGEYVSRVRTSGADKAISDARRVREELEKLRDRKIMITMHTRRTGERVAGYTGVGGQVFADGGPVIGPGTGTSDDVLMWGSNGEYMLRQRAASKLGRARLDFMNRTGELPSFAAGGLLGGYAAGGQVQPTFVNLEGVFTAMMARLEAAAQRAAERAAARWNRAHPKSKPRDADDFYQAPRVNVRTFERDLGRQLAVQRRWQRDLRAITRRAGADVAEALEQMGAEGVPLVRKFAGASAYQLRLLTRQLRELGMLAPTALGQYRAGLISSTRAQQQFNKDLQTLVKRGHGGLAAALADLGEEGAKIAREAAGASSGTLADLAKRVAAATAAQEQTAAMPAILKLIAILQAGKGAAGVKALVDGSGMGVADVLTTVTRFRKLIEAAGSGNLRQLNADLEAINAGRQPKGYRYGGIAAEGEMYRIAERGTGGEVNVPLRGISRARAAGLVREIDRAYSLSPTSTSSTVVYHGGALHVTVSGGDPGTVRRVVSEALREHDQQLLRRLRAGSGTRG